MCFSDHLYSLLQIFSYINFNILIHAPAKGATYICDVLDLDYEFQSTLPRRERPLLSLMFGYGTKFQSTLPRRERLGTRPKKYYRHHYFNPRSREGSDWLVLQTSSEIDDFNPRSREGSDPAVFLVVSEHVPISIHAPAKGATCISRS